jgi:hypothetical protein
MPINQSLQKSPSKANTSASKIPITPELVSKVADLVFALWLNDLKIIRERNPRPRINLFHSQGDR